ncbi:precursor of CEP5-like [Senna tora]|uniref:Precursor of CEP5-like n=1 Tax=Senna tora TaxID=362788 RepID=A0A834SU79_9FABA|nr:precursor of CEP5-like [Senna tora]
MAQNKLFFSLIFLALIFFHGFQCIHGIRNLEKQQYDEPHNVHAHGGLLTTNANVSPSTPPPTSAALGHDLDDFRPTDPGHSPGVGHSAPLTTRAPSPC